MDDGLGSPPSVLLKVRTRKRHTAGDFYCLVGSEPERSVNLLIETGSEVDLIRGGVVDSAHFVPARSPLQLWAANSGGAAGGRNEVVDNIRIEAIDCDSKKKIAITTPTYLYEASTEDDITLSLLWLAERGFDVCADRHGLMGHIDGHKVWVGGLEEG